ncbi:MAG: hypothetical protein QF566_04950, partial [Candidatus Thalassarchaeaceae archaeon]|nr:hypothetical protein [Candidatus Thalassarchaeaceae archaeon]
MSFGRLLLYLALLFGILFQFYLSGEWGENIYGYIFTGALLLLAAFLVMTGGKPKKRQRPRQRPSTKAVVDETDSFELPEAVVEEEDGGSRRDRKVATSKEASTSESDESDEEDVIQLEEEVVKEEVHIAEEYVVDIDAEQVEEADIEEFVEERRGKREEIKKRIEKRRRGQLADIRASAARMWSKQDGGEDLLSVLSQPGHGLTVLDEPENVETGHPYGATYVRIDDARILKLRIPLDSGFIAATEFEEEV